MRIYDIHNQHPEWVENPTEHRAEIREAAHAYIWDFFKMGADVRDRVLLRDLNAIVGNRNKLPIFWEYVGGPETEPTEYKENKAKRFILENIFTYIIRYLAYYGYNLQSGDVDRFYGEHGDNELEFISIKDWPVAERKPGEDFPDKIVAELNNMLYAIEHEKDNTPYINLGEEKATTLFEELKGKIASDKENFLWYFGDDNNRRDKSQPKPIIWYGGTNEFAYLCFLINLHISGKVMNEVPWGRFTEIFKNESGKNWDTNDTPNGALSNYVSGFRGRKKLPTKFVLKVFSDELNTLKKWRAE